MRYFFLIICSFGMWSLVAQDELTGQDEFATALAQYMELSGASLQFDMVIDQMIGMQQGAFPGVPDAFWAEFSDEVHEQGFQSIVRLLEPVYRQHYTQEELDALVEFYSSDIGRSIAKKTPLVTQESMQVGAEWGAALAASIMEKLQEAEDEGRIQRH